MSGDLVLWREVARANDLDYTTEARDSDGYLWHWDDHVKLWISPAKARLSSISLIGRYVTVLQRWEPAESTSGVAAAAEATAAEALELAMLRRDAIHLAVRGIDPLDVDTDEQVAADWLATVRMLAQEFEQMITNDLQEMK